MLPDNLLTTQEAAALTGYANAYFRQLIKRGHLHAEKRGRDWFLDRAEVLAWQAEMQRLGDAKFGRRSGGPE